eukprot:Rmarinus@m.4382
MTVAESTLLEEVGQLFAGSDDFTKIEDIKSAVLEGASYAERRQNTLKEIIKGLHKQIAELEQASVPSLSPEDHERKLKTIEKEKRLVVENIRKMEAECMSLHESIQKSVKIGHNMKSDRRQFNEDVAIDVPQLQTKVNLYEVMTGITWDLSCNEPRGYVANSQGQAAHFDLSGDNHSDFGTCNKLWALVEA